MNVGQNLYNWFIGNAQYGVLIGIAALAVYFIAKKETTKLISTLIVGLIAIGLVFNTMGVKDFLLEVFNKAIGK